MLDRYLLPQILEDLPTKLVILTGPRQVGKTTVAHNLLSRFENAQALNWDVAADRDVIVRQAWRHDAGLVVFDEIHKMRDWKGFLKGAWDGRSVGQAMLVTGSARMDTAQLGGESLAGRYFALRLHPFSVREWMQVSGMTATDALNHLLERGGFPEPCFAKTPLAARRWRQQYASDLIREDVVEFSRVQEIKSMQLFVQLLRERVGSPIKLSGLALALQITPNTAKRYLDILEALHIVFRVTPWHRDVARSLLKEPKIYFYDTGLVLGDEGAKLENAVACMLLKATQFAQDAQAENRGLHTIRDKEGHEIDFVLTLDDNVTHLIEVKTSQTVPSAYLHRMAEHFAQAETVQIVHQIRQESEQGSVAVRRAGSWLADLAA